MMSAESMASLPSAVLRRLWSSRHELAGATVYWSGLARAFEWVAQPSGAIILMYHSIATDHVSEFVDPANRLSPVMFERQMAFLGENRRVVPLSQVVDDIASGSSPPAGTVCITFDDGYLDTLTVAAPILERHGLPATVFLATGYVERGETQWADTLHWLLQRRTVHNLRVPSLNIEIIDLMYKAERNAVRKLLHRQLLEASYPERRQLLAELEHQLRPVGRAPRLTLNWDEVRELCRRYSFIEIGGHTRDHIDLRRHLGETARLQINDCVRDLRRELGVEPRHFSFPYARWCDESRNMVCESDWRSAVGMGKGIRIAATSDRFAMPRIESPRTMTELRFKTSGAYPGALSMLGLM